MDFPKFLRHDDAPRYRKDGAVNHPDASVLLRPFDPPRYIIAACVVGALIAAIAGGFVASRAIDQILHGAERNAATVEENINREISYDFPQLASLISLDDESILSQFSEAGYTTYEFSEEGAPLDVMKLPSDTTLADAAIVYAGGIGNMDAVTASKYLVGSWRFSTDREEGVTMSIRYADLKAADAASAIQTALEAQGWTAPEGAELQTDSVGNTYMEGTVETDAGTCSWRVACVPLSDMYDISGLPETAQYVGVHLTMN